MANVFNTGSYTVVSGSEGADSIVNGQDENGNGWWGTSNVTVDAKAGNDTIDGYFSDNSSISGGAGDDVILNSDRNYWSGSSLTINGGEGDDTIGYVSSYRKYSFYGNSKVYQYASGDGNDVIYGYNYNDTIQLLDSDVTVTSLTTTGDDYKLQFSEGSITLKFAKQMSNRYTYSYGVTPLHILDASGNYQAYLVDGNAVKSVSVYNIHNDSSMEVEGTSGADLVEVRNHGTSLWPNVSLGGGNDTLFNYAENINYNYSSGDGNDVIYNYFNGFNGNVYINSGTFNGVSHKNSDDIISIGSNTITLKNNGRNFHIYDASDTDYYYYDYKLFNYVGSATTGSSKDEYFIGYNYRNQTIDGGAGDDYINEYYSFYSTLLGGAGNDTLSIDGGSYSFNNVLIGCAGDDYIKDGGSNTIIQYADGMGNDIISNLGNDSSVEITSGNIENISVNGNRNLVVNVGSGSLTFTNLNGSNGLISVNKNDKVIRKSSLYYDYSTKNYEAYEGTDEDEFIFSTYLRGERITGDYDYNNSRYNYSYSSPSIKGGGGNDIIYSRDGRGILISGGDGNDSIYSYDNYHETSYMGDGNYFEFINTIIGGAGDDTIKFREGYRGNSDGVIIQYGADEGNDVIQGYSDFDTIELLSGSSLTNVSRNGDDIILTINNSNTITLKDAKDKIINTKEADKELNSIFFNGRNTLKAIYNNNYNASVEGTENDDFIYNYGNGYNSTIDAGDGDDIINNYGWNSSINAGAGDDIIYDIYYDPTTIKGGTGNDTMYLTSYPPDEVIQYTKGDGNDVVSVEGSNYNHLTFDLGENTSVDSVVQQGKDIILNVTEGKITLKDVDTYTTVPKIMIRSVGDDGKYIYTRYIGNKALYDVMYNNYNYYDYYYSDDEESYSSPSKNTVSGSTESDYLNTGWWSNNVVVDAKEGDDFIDSCSRYANVNAGAGDDTLVNGRPDIGLWYWNTYEKATLNGGAGDDLIQNIGSGYYYYEYEEDDDDDYYDYGIDVPSQTSINGGSGNDIIETQSIIDSIKGMWVWYEDEYDEYGENGTDVWEADAYYVGTEGEALTIKGGTGNDTIRNKYLYIPTEKYTDTRQYNIWNDDETSTRVTVTSESYFNESANTYVSTTTWKYSDGTPTRTSTYTSKLLYNRVIQYSAGDGDDVIEDYHGPQTVQIYEGTKTFGDVIMIDGKYATQASGSDVLINVESEDGSNKGTIRLIKPTGTISIVGGNFTDPFEDDDNGDDNEDTTPSGLDTVTLTDKDPKTYKATSMVGTINATARTKAINITGNDCANLINGGSGKQTTDGGAGRDTFIKQTFGEKTLTVTDEDASTINTAIDATVITIDASARNNEVTLLGNSKNNVITTGQGDNIIITGKGKDTVIASGGGNTTITDYEVGKDKIKFNVEISDAYLSGSDLVLQSASAKVTVKDAADKKVTVIDKDGKSQPIIVSTEVKLANSDGNSFKAYSSVASIDASKRTKGVDITANAKNNTITGGKGNDTLTGGAGNDTFVYNSGGKNDIITDYNANSAEENDIIRLGAKVSISKAQIVGNDY